jgi:hypothetical protein
VTNYLTKKISKKKLWVWNLDLEDKRKATKRMEAGEKEGNGIKEEDEEPKLPAIIIGKCKVDELFKKDDNFELEAKCTRFAESRLLNFEGLVSSLFKSFSDFAKPPHSMIAALCSKQSRPAWSSQGL